MFGFDDCLEDFGYCCYWLCGWYWWCRVLVIKIGFFIGIRDGFDLYGRIFLREFLFGVLGFFGCIVVVILVLWIFLMMLCNFWLLVVIWVCRKVRLLLLVFWMFFMMGMWGWYLIVLIFGVYLGFGIILGFSFVVLFFFKRVVMFRFLLGGIGVVWLGVMYFMLIFLWSMWLILIVEKYV